MLRARRAMPVMFNSLAYWQRVKNLQPAALWPFWDASGTDAVDISGNTRTAAYSASGITLGAAGKDGKTSVTLDGTNGSINIYSAINGVFSATAGGFSAQFKVSAVDDWAADSAYRRLFTIMVDANNRITAYKHGTVANRIDFIHAAGGTTKTLSLFGINTTDWFELGCTWSVADDAFIIYYNGVRAGKTDSLGTWAGSLSSTECRVGAWNATQQLWKGSIQYAKLFTFAPTPAQMATMGRTTNPGYFGWAKNAAAALTTPTYDGSGVAVHPSVYDAGVGQTWNGYRYWMGLTPYPGSDAEYENPSVLASTDGTTWVVPDGLTNPIEASPTPGHWNDPELIRVVDTMYYFFGDNSLTINYKTSTDGVTWGTVDALNISGASPAVILDGSVYRMWSVDITPSPKVLYVSECATVNGTYSTPVACTINGTPLGKTIWHLDIDKVGSVYYGWFVFCDTGTNGTNTILYLAISTDGLTWTVAPNFLLGPGPSGAWDSALIYRSCAVWNGTTFDLWYTGLITTNWHIGRTTVTIEA